MDRVIEGGNSGQEHKGEKRVEGNVMSSSLSVTSGRCMGDGVGGDCIEYSR